MKSLSSISLCIALSVSWTQGWAETVVPMKGQSSQQTQTDIAECQNIAAGQSASATSPSGGRLKGAAAGAAAGAAGAQVRGRQHDEFYDRVDDDIARIAPRRPPWQERSSVARVSVRNVGHKRKPALQPAQPPIPVACKGRAIRLILERHFAAVDRADEPSGRHTRSRG